MRRNNLNLTSKVLFGSTIAIGTLLLSVGCGGDDEGTPILVGLNLELSGGLAEFGVTELNVINLAFKQINAAGGIDGRRVEMITADNGTDPDRAEVRTKELIARGDLAAILGPEFSGGLLKSVPYAKESQMVILSGASTAPSLATRADDGFIFRSVPNDSFQGKAMAYYLRTLTSPPIDRPVVLYQNDTYGAGLKDVFVGDFQRRGGALNGTPIMFEPNLDTPQKVQEVWSQVVAANPSVVILIAFTGDAIKLIQKWDDSGDLRGLRWFFTDGVKDESFLSSRPNALEGMLGTSPTHATGPAYEEFATAYRQEFAKDVDQQVFTGNIYDSVYLLALGLAAQAAQGGSGAVLGGAGLRDAIRAVAGPPGTDKLRASEWQSAVAQIQSGVDINYDGAGSPCDFDAQNEVLGPYEVWKITLDGGKTKYVQERVLGASEFAQ